MSMITIDPYDCLGIEKGCTDEAIIKDAYKRKSVVLDPKNTNNLTRFEFFNLNKCYLQIKNNLKQKQQNYPQQNYPQQNYPSNYSQPDRFIPQMTKESRNNFIPTRQPQPSSIVYGANSIGGSGNSSGQTQRNFTAPIQKQLNSELSMNRFDPEKSAQEMLKYRPESLNYKDLLKHRDDKSLDNVLNLDSWNGMDSFLPSAPILQDQQGVDANMYIQSDIMHEQVYSLPKEYQESRSIIGGSGPVSTRDVQSFMGVYNSSGASGNSRKLNKNEFKQELNHMERQYLSSQNQEATEKQNLLQQLLFRNQN